MTYIIPATVRIVDLPIGTTLTGAELIEAVQTTNGVGNSVQISVNQIGSAVSGVPAIGTTGQFLQKIGTSIFSTVWANIGGSVLASTGLTQSGSTTVALSLSSTAGLSVLGVGGVGSAVPSAIGGTAAQVLRVNDAGNALAFGPVNLASAASVTGTLPFGNLPSIGPQSVFANSSNGTTTVSGTATPTLSQLSLVPNTASLSTGFSVTQAVAGSFTTANTNLNTVNITSDNANFSTQFGVGLLVNYTIGGSSMQGGREALVGETTLATTSSSSSLNRNYVGVVGIGQSLVRDNGTGLTATTAQGAVFGGNMVGALFSNATAFLNVSGCEFNTEVLSGATVYAKSLAQFSSEPGDKVQGSVTDSMLWLYNQSTGNPGWNNGILFDGSSQVWPISTTGTIIKTLGAATAAAGIDFSATSLKTAFMSKNYTVDGVGNITGGYFNSTTGFVRLVVPFNVATTAPQPTLLQFAMATGGAYKFETVLYCTAGSTGGTALEIVTNQPITSIIYDAQAYAAGALVAQARVTANSIILPISTSATTPTIRAIGLVQCGNTACNLIVALGQQASTTTNTVALAGSFIEAFQVT